MFSANSSSTAYGPHPNGGRPFFLPGLGQGLHRNQPRLSVTFDTTVEEIQESQTPIWDVLSDTSSLILVPDYGDPQAAVPLPDISEEPQDDVQHGFGRNAESWSKHRVHKKRKKSIFGFAKERRHSHREHHHSHHHDERITVVQEEDVGEAGTDGDVRTSPDLAGSVQSYRSSASIISTSKSGSSGSQESSEDDFENTVFMENLSEDLQEALLDGEDFDYYGLFAHPTHDLDEDVLKENIETQKDIVGRVKDQPWRMRRKLKLYRIAQFYIERYEGRLSKGRANVANFTKIFKQLRRTLENLIDTLQPWEERIKSVENRFGSAAASFFLLLRWIIWVNVIQTALVVSFIMVPEILTGEDAGSNYRKTMTDSERKTGLDFGTVTKYAGYLRYTPIFYGWYGDLPQFPNGYRLPLAYFVTTICVLVHSFWVVLSKMATNVRQGTMISSGDQYQYALRTYSSWDYMIANRDTADNKVAAVSRAYKELITDEEHTGEEEHKWRQLFLRVLAWVITGGLLVASFFILTQIMEWKANVLDKKANPTFIESYAVSLTQKAIQLVFPELFERLELIEEYHPLTNLKLHLARISMLTLVLNSAFIRDWNAEAIKATEEAEEVKDQFAWIWNSSIKRPPDWQTRTAIPHLPEGHEGHGAAEHGNAEHGTSAGHALNTAHEEHVVVHETADSPGHVPAEHVEVGHEDHGDESTTEPYVLELPAVAAVAPDVSLADGSGPMFITSTPPTSTINTHDAADQHNELASTYSLPASDHVTEVDVAPAAVEIEANVMTLNHTMRSTALPAMVVTRTPWPTRPFNTRPTTTPAPPPPVTPKPVNVTVLKTYCWENVVALEGLTNLVTESITSVFETILTEFVRGLFVRFLAKCWFWDLESVPGYPSFRVSENVIGLINGQQMAWLAFFFAPALIPINLVRLIFLMYFRSWVTQVCDVPPETMFNTGQGNNFYMYILLLMLFISTLWVGYASVTKEYCSTYEHIYEVLTTTVSSNLSPLAASVADYATSPALILPLLMLLFIIIFYLFTVRMALSKQTKNLKRTLEIERTEEKRKLLTQIEAKRKKEQDALLGRTATSEAQEISIEQAKSNAEGLLDKMKNRGFPPEEHGLAAAKVDTTKTMLSELSSGSHMRDAVGKVIQANIVVRRLSEKNAALGSLSAQAIEEAESQENEAEETTTNDAEVVIPIPQLVRSRDKSKKKSKSKSKKKLEEPVETLEPPGEEMVEYVEEDYRLEYDHDPASY